VDRFSYYESMKRLARELRERFGHRSPRVTRSDLRKIYRAESIKIDLWPYKLRKLRGAYFCGTNDCGPSVLLAKGLPEEPMVFTMAHELKHHFVDRETALSFCDVSNETNYIEIGAEVFAAELIFPESDFVALADSHGLKRGKIAAPDVVRFKRSTRTTLSHKAVVKRFDFLGYADAASFVGVKWQKLDEEINGEPLYKKLLRRRR